MNDVAQLRFSRWMTVLTGLVAVVVALFISSISEATEDTVLETSYLWMALNSVIPAAFLLAVFSRRASGRHALAALGCGATWTFAMISLYLYDKYQGREPFSVFYIGTSAMLVTIIIGFVSSCFSRRQSDGELADLTLWTLNNE